MIDLGQKAEDVKEVVHLRFLFWQLPPTSLVVWMHRLHSKNHNCWCACLHPGVLDASCGWLGCGHILVRLQLLRAAFERAFDNMFNMLMQYAMSFALLCGPLLRMDGDGYQ
ncbi:unnamed protein product [Polarella glacialis]|uniref:Uncharacterized protein n=1 Tax=Polarella glacialis TaxID=89957 RepID=A0A813F684_POLGL|nr:unnamed protein product [Polarella glacialis]